MIVVRFLLKTLLHIMALTYSNPVAKRAKHLLTLLFALSVVQLGFPLLSFGQERNTDQQLDVPYVASKPEVVQAMLTIAAVNKDDIIYDLGCGDGRIVITAAKEYGATGVGIDIDPKRIEEANANAVQEGVTDKVKFIEQDLFDVDFSDASVVTLYLLPYLNLKLRPKLLEQLKPGTRIVSNEFDMGDWKPERQIKVGKSTIYFWTVPERNTVE